jgi:hypothetical protein
MEYPWGVPTIPKVLHKFVERFERSGVVFGGVDPQVLFISRAQVTPVWLVPLTGLTSADSCWVLLGWKSGWVLCCPVLLLFEVWGSLELGRHVWQIWGFYGSCQVSPAGTSLTGGVGRCGSSWCSAAFSSPWRWLLVPRASSTPVPAWSWPTRVVELETCVGSRVHLVGASISFKKNFCRLPFTPPSLVRRFGPSLPPPKLSKVG